MEPVGPAPDPDAARDGSSAASLAERAYATLEERIVTAKLAPGTVLSEQALASDLGIGRTPVREALQRLANEGLVTVLPRRGVLVTEINVQTQFEILAVRRALERLLVQLASDHAGPAERTRFAAIAGAMDEAAQTGDGTAFMRLDVDLNSLIAEVANNAIAKRAIRLTRGLVRRFWYIYSEEVADLPRCAGLHARLARAIAKGETGAATAALDALLDYIEEFTNATLARHRAR
jgi:DNA-binding GntR family transcriptional regulator